MKEIKPDAMLIISILEWTNNYEVIEHLESISIKSIRAIAKFIRDNKPPAGESLEDFGNQVKYMILRLCMNAERITSSAYE